MTAITTAPVRPRGSRRSAPAWIAATVVLAAVVVMTAALSSSMPDRRTVIVQNRTGAFVTIRAAGPGEDRWLGLGTVDPNTTTTFEEVADQGGLWRLELTVGPDHIGEIRMTAEQLRAAGWRVTIPARAAEQLPFNRRAG